MESGEEPPLCTVLNESAPKPFIPIELSSEDAEDSISPRAETSCAPECKGLFS